MNGDRVNAAHSAVRAWVGQVSKPIVYGMLLSQAIECGMVEPAPAIPSTSAYCGGCSGLYELYDGTPVDEFAARSATTVRAVRAALAADLSPALRADGKIDIAHPAALAFLARHPLDQDDEHTPRPFNGHDFLCPACPSDGRTDLEHPIFLAFLARWLGRVPHPGDSDEFAEWDPS